MAPTDPLATAVRRETELLIGRLVMQNTTLTAQVNALADTVTAIQKDLADTKAALVAAQTAAADRNGHVPEEIVQ